MGWFKDRNGKKPQKLTRVVTKFIAEQDGPSEGDLKAHFVDLFRQESVVERAYLSLAEHGDETGVQVTFSQASNKPLRQRNLGFCSS